MLAIFRPVEKHMGKIISSFLDFDTLSASALKSYRFSHSYYPVTLFHFMKSINGLLFSPEVIWWLNFINTKTQSSQ